MEGRRPAPVVIPWLRRVTLSAYLPSLAGAFNGVCWNICCFSLPSCPREVFLVFVFFKPFFKTDLGIFGGWVALSDSHAVPCPPGLSVKIMVCCLKTSFFRLD